VARRGGAGAKPRTPAAKLFAWALGKRTEARPHPPVGDHPVYWREVWVDPGSSPGVIRRLLAVGVVCAVVFPFLSIVVNTLIWSPPSTPRREFQEGTKAWVCAVTVLLGGLMMLRAAVRGAGAIAGERDRDTWTRLLATPPDPPEV